MTKKTKRIVRIIILSFVVVLIAGIIYALTPDKIENYSEEEHAQIIREKIDKKYPDKKIEFDEETISYNSYKIYPLYNEKDKLTHFIIEYEPYGFNIVLVRDGLRILGGVSYFGSSFFGLGKNQWSPYIVDTTNSQSKLDEDKKWILDENGERIYHKRSPYFVTGNINERKYLIEKFPHDYIFAVKKDGQFINLVSGEKFDCVNVENQATLEVFILPKGHFLL